MLLARTLAPYGVGLSLLVWAPTALALEVPKLKGYVNDYANIIPDAAEARLEKKLSDYESTTGRQYAVLTIESLEGEDLEGFSIRTVETWKLGQKKENNGLLLLVVPGDRKVRIEVGYGLEGEITDVRASRVIREILTPAFKQEDYAGGIERALDSLMTKGEPGERAPQRAVKNAPGGAIDLVVIVVFCLLPLVLMHLGGQGGGKKRRGRRRRQWGGAYIDTTWTGDSWGGDFSGGSDFSGGGGSFGGGGASGDW